MQNFRFIDRQNLSYPKGFDKLLQDEIEAMSHLALKESEASFISSQMPYIPPTYIDFLRGFRFNRKEISIQLSSEGHLSIEATAL